MRLSTPITPTAKQLRVPMNRAAKVGATLLATLLLAAFVFAEAPLPCTARFSIEGEYRGPSSYSISRVSSSASGFMIKTEESLSSPLTLFAYLPGKQNFQFRYSNNVTGVHLRSQSENLYEGAPIAAFDATGKARSRFIAIEPQWTGSSVSVEVSDQCSVSDVFRAVRGAVHW